ncbi:MAG: 16S rRNA (cytosine(1402)-N(4))-methyltransferase RsmH [Xanthomonadales bacterium]|nr:16S rRNA (cytosine(1402)-N(4))-methyltransferase RsmH [Xanthomonadales bacterium]
MGEHAAAPTHIPVLFSAVMEGLAVRDSGVYLDGTFGRGGHARGVLERLGAEGRLLVMDKDPAAIAEAEQLAQSDARVSVRQDSFAHLAEWDATASGLDGVLLDLGVSSPQLDNAERGFSFMHDGPLDMRMNPQAGQSVAEWLAEASESAIADVLWHYGEERQSRRIARAIVARRTERAIERTADLAALIAGCVGRGESGKHPATRSFQALRIFINRELDDLDSGLAAAHARLRSGGRLAVISFHSLEDRRVKQFMAAHAKPPASNRRLPEPRPFTPTLRLIGSKQVADDDEVRANPRARSAVLRVAERVG